MVVSVHSAAGSANCDYFCLGVSGRHHDCSGIYLSAHVEWWWQLDYSIAHHALANFRRTHFSGFNIQAEKNILHHLLFALHPSAYYCHGVSCGME